MLRNTKNSVLFQHRRNISAGFLGPNQFVRGTSLSLPFLKHIPKMENTSWLWRNSFPLCWKCLLNTDSCRGGTPPSRTATHARGPTLALAARHKTKNQECFLEPETQVPRAPQEHLRTEAAAVAKSRFVNIHHKPVSLINMKISTAVTPLIISLLLEVW